MQGEFGSYNLANKWAFKLDPILENVQQRRELDQVENTRNFAQNGRSTSSAITNGRSGMKTKFGTWEIPWGDNRFQRLSGDINLDYDDSIASLPISAASSFGAAYPLTKVFIKKTQRKGMVTVVIVSYVQ
jgi:hypothetical protein